jgi:hypothetical protein
MKTTLHYLTMKIGENLVFHSGKYVTSRNRFHVGTGFSFTKWGKNTTIRSTELGKIIHYVNGSLVGTTRNEHNIGINFFVYETLN